MVSPDDVRAVYLSSAALAALGRHDEALRMARRALELDGGESPIVLYNVACSFALSGRPDDALDLLERAYEQGFAHRESLLHDADLASLRDHPRFRRLTERLLEDETASS